MFSRKYPFTIVCVEAKKGGTFVSGNEYGCESFREAINQTNRLQEEFDADCDPVRVYVYKENDPVPIAAGLGLSKSAQNSRTLDSQIKRLINNYA